MGADLRLTSAAAVMPLWPSPLKRGKGNQKKKRKKREREKKRQFESKQKPAETPCDKPALLSR